MTRDELVAYILGFSLAVLILFWFRLIFRGKK